jgi:hypothetical protein
MHESGSGPSRHFAAAQQARRFRSEADINFGVLRRRWRYQFHWDRP